MKTGKTLASNEARVRARTLGGNPPRVEPQICLCKTCPHQGKMVDHTVSFVSEYEAKYRVLQCPSCGLRTFTVIKYYERFMNISNKDAEDSQ